MKKQLTRPKTALNVRRVLDKEIYIGRQCRYCTQAFKVGSIIVEDFMSDAPYGSKHWLCHVRCLRELLAGAPFDEHEVDKEFERLRSDIAEHGLWGEP